VRKEIYPIAAWDGIQPNCAKMEEKLGMCVCVCVWKQNGYGKVGLGVCVFVLACACGNGGVLNVFGSGISPKFM